MKTPTVAIVGRTNVGKSTLFNRFAEAHKALVSDIPGTTRDRNETDCFWRGQIVRVVDTGGLTLEKNDSFEESIRNQVQLAIRQADVILFVVDVQTGVVPDDRELAALLRKTKKPVILVGNKSDNKKLRDASKNESWKSLGFDLPTAISSTQGTGVGDLLDDIWELLINLNNPPIEISDFTPTKIVVIGKPNAGKSSLINKIIGEERFITSSIAHTTREPNDTLIKVNNKQYLLIDTAGIRKLSKVRKSGGLELAGVSKSLAKLKKADVALLVVDVTKDIDAQIKHLVSELMERKVPVIIVVNKWDLVADKTAHTQYEYLSYFESKLPFFTYAPIIFVSSLTGQRVEKIFDLVAHVQDERYKYIDEEELAEFLKRIVRKHKPARGKGIKHPEIISLTQTAVAPAKFILTIKGSRTDILHPSYLRFIENRLREEFGFDGTPVIIKARTRRKS